ncbi:DUF7089 family protein [Halomarina oriensis]|uniref:Uncharacterized protein n=1 Tax=Halomarina oriensis TaxID=671145 RepID=A0A6B0GQF7_9EURY|nr:hypothetical protein [Halomarina oriensis]MWG34903.1 hypothetical protein [Halomarina oriensis]
MFSNRDLPADLDAVRAAHTPGAVVLDCERDFETLPPDTAETLGLFVDRLEPASFPESWLPDDAPELLARYASETFTVGLPGDGGVTWTAQTTPPTVLVKARTTGSPEEFLDFLVAEALVEAGLGVPEGFLGFFGEQYVELAAATTLSPADTYQLAVALYDAYLGLHTRETFAGWADEHPRLHEAWHDAGERLQPRLDGLAREVATDRTAFPAAAELACSGVKHGCDLPTPFGALDTAAYRESGAEYAVVWARKTFEKLAEE